MDIIQSEKEDVTACGNNTAPMVAETYMIKNCQTGGVLADSHGKLVVYSGAEYPDQRWAFIQNDSGMKIVNIHNCRCIADSHGTPVVYSGENYADQYWIMEPTAKAGIFKFKNCENNTYLMADNNKACVDAGAEKPSMLWRVSLV